MFQQIIAQIQIVIAIIIRRLIVRVRDISQMHHKFKVRYEIKYSVGRVHSYSLFDDIFHIPSDIIENRKTVENLNRPSFFI
jgi:hypothetical protein